MNDDLDLVHEHMLEIMEDVKTMNSVDMKVKWKSFIDKYPAAYRILLSGMDLDILDKIMSGLKEVQSGSKDLEEISKDVGEKISEKTIYPIFGKPPQEEIDRLYEKAKKELQDDSP